MSQHPGGQPPNDPYYGQQPVDSYAQQQPPPNDPYFGQQPVDPYAQQQPPPNDPYFGQPSGGDPYAQQQPPPNDPSYGQQPADPYAQQAQQQQVYYGQAAQVAQAGWQAPPAEVKRRGGTGGAIVGIFLVVLGVWFLFRDEIALDFGRVWPVVAVALGVLMVIAAFVPRRTR